MTTTFVQLHPTRETQFGKRTASSFARMFVIFGFPVDEGYVRDPCSRNYDTEVLSTLSPFYLALSGVSYFRVLLRTVRLKFHSKPSAPTADEKSARTVRYKLDSRVKHFASAKSRTK